MLLQRLEQVWNQRLEQVWNQRLAEEGHCQRHLGQEPEWWNQTHQSRLLSGLAQV